jgi:hypothetical protein
MKASRMTSTFIPTLMFAALMTYGLGAHALFLPGNQNTPIYYCNNQTIQAHIYRQADGQNVVYMEQKTENRAPEVVINENVNELSNKSQTVYTADDMVLKINHDPSGFMPSTLFVTKNASTNKIDMSCQIVYKIMPGQTSAY